MAKVRVTKALCLRDSMDSKIIIESIWEDEDLFEVRVSGGSKGFSGIADCYTNRTTIKNLAVSLEGYPKKIGDEISFTSGENQSQSYFALHFKCKGGSGHVSVRVNISYIDNFMNGPEETYKAEFELEVERAAIDRFSKSLAALSESKLKDVRSELNGKT